MKRTWVLSLDLIVVLLSFCEQSQGLPLNEIITHYEPVTLLPLTISSTERNVNAQLHFTAHGREFKLHLETHSGLFEPDFHVVIVGKDGRTTKRNMNTRGFVTGYVIGELNSTVHGHLNKNTLDIVINSQGETYHIEPISKYNLHTSKYNSVIYKASDVHYNLNHTRCSIADSARLRLIQESAKLPDTISNLRDLNQLKRKRSVVPGRDTCTVRIVADYEFFTGAGDSQESTTLELMMLHMTTADIIYRNTLFTGGSGDLTGFGISIHSAMIYTDTNPATNPLIGDFSTDELLEAFAETDFDDVCLGHLFTYRDFSGVIGLAYLADPNGQFAGGICQKRTTTSMGRLSLNTGFTSLLNFGRTLPRAVSLITTAHELGHNHGSPHDPPRCTPEGSQPKYIMFPSATNNGLQEFSECSRESIGQTLDVRSGLCFIQRPTSSECGNGIIESGEDCDCGSKNMTECAMVDRCCTVNCTLVPVANCSARASSCCNNMTCQPLQANIVCLTGDTAQGGCQNDSRCDGVSPNCPNSTPSENGTSCNDNKNVCQDGSCTGSPCPLYNNSKPCLCTKEEELCDVCCLFDGDDGECISTFNRAGVPNVTVQAGYSCANYTGFCTVQNSCLRVNNDDPLDKLRDILLSFTSILQWLENNWYWVIVGFACLIVLIILIQVTYRRKKIQTDGTPETNSNRRWRFGRQNRRAQQREAETYGYFQTAGSTPVVDEDPLETSNLLRQNRTTGIERVPM